MISAHLKIIIPVIFGGSETVLLFNLLQSTSVSTGLAIFLSLVTGVVTGFAVHFSANFIRKAISKLEERKRLTLIIAIAFITAVILGIWRATVHSDVENINSAIAMDHQTVSNVGIVAVLPYILISFFAFVTALSFELRYWISEEQKKKQDEYIDKAKEVKATQRQLDALEKEKNGIVAESHNVAALVILKQEYATATEYRLLTLADELHHYYESVNLDHRQDGQCPDFFGKPVNWEFNLYFSKFFNTQNRNAK